MHQNNIENHRIVNFLIEKKKKKKFRVSYFIFFPIAPEMKFIVVLILIISIVIGEKQILDENENLKV